MRNVFAVILLLWLSPVFGQKSVRGYSWEEVKNANPDTVFAISFRKMKLDSIPVELSKFTSLKKLDLGKNKLTRLPAFLTDFKSLEELNIEKNRFDIFPLPVCQMTGLKRLIINRNNIGNVPDCIEYVRNLEYFDAYDNPIGSLPESFVRLKSLKKVDFSGVRTAPSFQEKWIQRLPNVEWVFDAPCDCME